MCVFKAFSFSLWIRIDGVSKGEGQGYTFENTRANHTITAVFMYTGVGQSGDGTGGVTGKTYHFTKGINAEWEIGSENGLEFTVDGALSDFTRAEVDGKTIDKSNYDVKSGSTIITLKPAYLATLEAGTHKLTAVYTDGSVTTGFTITEAELIEDDDDIVDDDIIDDVSDDDGDDDVSGNDDISDDDISGDDDDDVSGGNVADDDVSDDDTTGGDVFGDDSNPGTGVAASCALAAVISLAAAGAAARKRRK